MGAHFVMTAGHECDITRAMVAHDPCIASVFACQSGSLKMRVAASATACLPMALRSRWREKRENCDGTAIVDRWRRGV